MKVQKAHKTTVFIICIVIMMIGAFGGIIKYNSYVRLDLPKANSVNKMELGLFGEQRKVELVDQDKISEIMKMLSSAKRCDIRTSRFPLLCVDLSFYTISEDDEIIGPYYLYHVTEGKKYGYYIMVSNDEIYKISDEYGEYIWEIIKELRE